MTPKEALLEINRLCNEHGLSVVAGMHFEAGEYPLTSYSPPDRTGVFTCYFDTRLPDGVKAWINVPLKAGETEYQYGNAVHGGWPEIEFPYKPKAKS